MSTDERIFSVEDHGLWRGHRTWTVRMTGARGPAQISVIDVKTERLAIDEALGIYRERRDVTPVERAAMQTANAELARRLA